METTFVLMKEDFAKGEDAWKKGERYEIDSATASKWIELEIAEAVEDPSEKLAKAFDQKISSAIDKVAEKIKIEHKVPAVAKTEDEKSLGDFCYMLAKGNREALAGKYGEKVLSVGSDTALVPTPLANQMLFSRGFEDSILSRVRRVAMPSDTFKYPVLNQAGVSPSSGSSAYFGGVVGAFDSEDDDANDTEPAWASITLNANKYTMSTQTTLEIRQDSVIDLENTITDLFSRAFVGHMDHFILNGSGSGQLTGIIDHAGTETVQRQTANQINYLDVINMVAKKASGGDSWFWIISNSALAQLLNLEDSAGNLVYQANARDAVGRTLMGYPVVVSEYAKTLGTGGDFLLCNLTDGYVFGDRMAVTLAFSDHYSFLKGRRVWKLEARVDGKPVHASALTLADGSTTVSEIVQLDDPAS